MKSKRKFVAWTRDELEKKLKDGFIRSYDDTKLPKKKHYEVGGKIVATHFKKKNKALEYISWNLWYWCNQKAVTLQEEYVFYEYRGWRFDFAIEAYKIAIEYEGGIYMAKGGHNNFKGMQRDIQKYTQAQSMGWRVIRLHDLNYTSLLPELEKLIEHV